MSALLTEYAQAIQQEMLVHPALFTHPSATQIAIIGGGDKNLAQEIGKHATVSTIWQVTQTPSKNTVQDARLKVHVGNIEDWLMQIAPDSLDIIIVPESATESSKNFYQHYFNALQPNGILIQQSECAFQPTQLKTACETLRATGFNDTQIINFPQPSIASGWSTAIMAVKQGTFKRIREKDIFNKSFATRYYNFDMHKAALVMAEFMRTEWAE